jgi:hypothetical protein
MYKKQPAAAIRSSIPKMIARIIPTELPPAEEPSDSNFVLSPLKAS